MKTTVQSRRWMLVGIAVLLAAWLPIPIEFYVTNASGAPVHARISGTDVWIEAVPGAHVDLGGYGYDGLCSPPDRYLPPEFSGLEIKLADGQVVEVSRATFAERAVHDRGWTYRFEGR